MNETLILYIFYFYLVLVLLCMGFYIRILNCVGFHIHFKIALSARKIDSYDYNFQILICILTLRVYNYVAHNVYF